jgi:hypothetical protein
MTREQHLKFCQKCEHRKLNLKQGIICGLTDQIAAFENTCGDYIEDKTIIEQAIEDEKLINEANWSIYNSWKITLFSLILAFIKFAMNGFTGVISVIIICTSFVWLMIALSSRPNK